MTEGDTTKPRSSFLNSERVDIAGGQFNSTQGNVTNLTIYCHSADAGNLAPLVEKQKAHSPGTFWDPQASSISQRSNIIYEQHLTTKRIGYPLWIPQPNRRLPLSYRRRGVSIGDVGILSKGGGFDFLFNVLLPIGDPINPKHMPDNFLPLDPPLDDIDICEYSEFDEGSYLASGSVEHSHGKRSDSVLSFRSCASDGAILTMPYGANSQDIANIARMKEYAATHAEDWYKFANGPRGREARNGDLRLVIGCDKTTAWGMATFQGIAEEQCELKFFTSPFGPGDSNSTTAVKHLWEQSGHAEAKTGPTKKESTELKRGDSTMEPDELYENQCLFVRTLNLMLGEDIWAGLQPETTNTRSIGIGQVVVHADGGPLEWGLLCDDHEGEDCDCDSSPEYDDTIFFTGPSLALDGHPSDEINEELLRMNPGAKVAITSDNDWGQLQNLGPSNPGDPFTYQASLLSRITASRNLLEPSGIVSLQLNESSITDLGDLLASIRDGKTTLERYLSGGHENCFLIFREIVDTLKSHYQKLSDAMSKVVIASIQQAQPAAQERQACTTADSITHLGPTEDCATSSSQYVHFSSDAFAQHHIGSHTCPTGAGHLNLDKDGNDVNPDSIADLITSDEEDEKGEGEDPTSIATGSVISSTKKEDNKHIDTAAIATAIKSLDKVNPTQLAAAMSSDGAACRKTTRAPSSPLVILQSNSGIDPAAPRAGESSNDAGALTTGGAHSPFHIMVTSSSEGDISPLPASENRGTSSNQESNSFSAIEDLLDGLYSDLPATSHQELGPGGKFTSAGDLWYEMCCRLRTHLLVAEPDGLDQEDLRLHLFRQLTYALAQLSFSTGQHESSTEAILFHIDALSGAKHDRLLSSRLNLQLFFLLSKRYLMTRNLNELQAAIAFLKKQQLHCCHPSAPVNTDYGPQDLPVLYAADIYDRISKKIAACGKDKIWPYPASRYIQIVLSQFNDEGGLMGDAKPLYSRDNSEPSGLVWQGDTPESGLKVDLASALKSALMETGSQVSSTSKTSNPTEYCKRARTFSETQQSLGDRPRASKAEGKDTKGEQGPNLTNCR